MLSNTWSQASSAGSITGVVRNASTGAPVPNADLTARSSSGAARITTGSQGQFSLAGLSGPVSITALDPYDYLPVGKKTVTVAPGQDLAGIEIRVQLHSRIGGRVTGENRKPLAGIQMQLLTREYQDGKLRYLETDGGVTDADGSYFFGGLEPGRGYIIRALVDRTGSVKAISSVPENPAKREPIWATTYYPGTDLLAGAQVLTLGSNEEREHVDFEMQRSASYCLEGRLRAANADIPLKFTIAERWPGAAAPAGPQFRQIQNYLPAGIAGTDGRVRICDLAPGDYWLMAVSSNPSIPWLTGFSPFSITNRDAGPVVATALPQIATPGSVVWAGENTDARPHAAVNVTTSALEAGVRNIAVPGRFSMTLPGSGELGAQVQNLPSDAYVKDITYGGKSVLHETFSPAAGAELRIVLDLNGGAIAANVSDEDGHPVPGAQVVIIPSSAESESALAAALVTGESDAAGSWTSPRLAPGQYYVLAVPLPIDKSVETIANLFFARGRAQKVDLTPGATASLTVALDRQIN